MEHVVTAPVAGRVAEVRRSRRPTRSPVARSSRSSSPDRPGSGTLAVVTEVHHGPSQARTPHRCHRRATSSLALHARDAPATQQGGPRQRGSTSRRSTCSVGSRSRSPASSGPWIRRSAEPGRTTVGDVMSDRVRIYEVGPRDGLQNEAARSRPPSRREFIGLLAAAGLREIEATSFVSPRAVPQLADADELMAHPRSTARRPLPGARPQRAGHGPRGGGRRRCHRRVHRDDRRVHDGEHRDDGRGIAGGLRPGPASRRRASGGGAGRTCRRRLAARTRAASTRGDPSRSPSACSSSASTRSASVTRSASASRARSRR